MPIPIAYFVNQYPKVSHSFIRREILALEQQGFDIQRIALRGWDEALTDKDDLNERTQTRYILQGGVLPILLATVCALLSSPLRFIKALRLALQMGWRAARPLPAHLACLAEACRMLQWLNASGALHVHAHFGTNSAEVVMLAHVLGGPAYSFTVHGPEEFDQPQFLKLEEKVRRASFVIAISSYGRSQLYRWVPDTFWNKIKVVHCGIENAFHQIPVAPQPVAARLVCVGRLCAQKGQLLLVEAARRLNEIGVQFELVLAGDGEMRHEIEKLIQKHDLGNRIRITGWISSDQVRDEILAARALVLPSFAEGLPVVIMEAMALRRPVLSTYVAGIPELVLHGENGWLFPAGAVDELVLAIETLLTRTAEELHAMGNAGHRRVLERHSADTEASRLARHFRVAILGTQTLDALQP